VSSGEKFFRLSGNHKIHKMKKIFAVWLLFMLMYPSIECADEVEKLNEERQEKLISTFQIVRFPNDVCIGTNSRNGTCYTSAECSDLSGTSAGSCADGFGVCCVFLITSCGSSSSENITYWTTPSSVSSGKCDLTICPKTDDICSIRLDFTSFTITGPSTVTTVQLNRKLGSPASVMEDTAGAAYGANLATNCQSDAFYVTSASPSSAPPTICGVNTDFHMYTEADVDRCNRLVFHLADVASTSVTMTNTRGITSLATRKWDITATQIECSSATVPPAGCTQYFWGGGKYILESYNHQSTTVGTSNLHLGSQHQRICIRKERGNCIGCFYAGADGLAVSGRNEAELHYSGIGACCAYATTDASIWGITAATALSNGEHAAEIGTYGFDCIVIPGAFSVGNQNGIANEQWTAQTSSLISQQLDGSPTANVFPTPSGPQLCGNGGSIGIGGADWEQAAYETAFGGTAVDNTVCSRIAPYVLEFISDDIESGGSIVGEFNSATQAMNQGFQIYHTQIEC